jgi:hypothetical protein
MVPDLSVNFKGFSGDSFVDLSVGLSGDEASLTDLCRIRKSRVARKLKLAMAGFGPRKCSSSE